MTPLKGGFGIHSNETVNWALLGKWHWQLENEDHVLWHDILIKNYSVNNEGWDGMEPHQNVSGIWKAIVLGMCSFPISNI